MFEGGLDVIKWSGTSVYCNKKKTVKQRWLFRFGAWDCLTVFPFIKCNNCCDSLLFPFYLLP